MYNSIAISALLPFHSMSNLSSANRKNKMILNDLNKPGDHLIVFLFS